MYVKSTLKCTEIEWPDDIKLESIGVNISLSVNMSLQSSPTASPDFYDQLIALLKLCNHKKETVLIGGFNKNCNEKKNRKNL